MKKSTPNRLLATIGLFLGLLLASCQPILPPQESHENPATQPGQGHFGEPMNNAGARPVPEIAWNEPPLCESNEQDQQAICAQLFYRADTDLRQLIWSGAGIQRELRALDDVPQGITSFAPDVTRLIVETPQGHTAGGPLYLYDLATEQLINLNEQLGLPVYSSISTLRIAGWHPDSQHVLLVNEDDEVAIWIDLESGRYQTLSLGIDTGQMAPPRHFVLAPDGSGFTFGTYRRDETGRDTQVSYLYWYDLATNETRLLLTVPSAQGWLAESAISPDGERLAYILTRGGRMQGRSEEMHLMELSKESTDTAAAEANINSRLLFAGNLGPTQPVWSPDGKHIALIRRDLSEPLRAGPEQPPPLGDLWIISTESGDATQLTFTEALDRPPVWSPDGQYLAFVTADSQIGMVAMADPGRIWQLDDLSLRPEFVQIAFAPLEENN